MSTPILLISRHAPSRAKGPLTGKPFTCRNDRFCSHALFFVFFVKCASTDAQFKKLQLYLRTYQKNGKNEKVNFSRKNWHIDWKMDGAHELLVSAFSNCQNRSGCHLIFIFNFLKQVYTSLGTVTHHLKLFLNRFERDQTVF